jgi:hypothetical protein
MPGLKARFWPETIRLSGLYIYLPGLISYVLVLKAKILDILG